MLEKLKELGVLKLQYQSEENECLVFDYIYFQTLRKLFISVGVVQINSVVVFESIVLGEGLKMCYLGKVIFIIVIFKDRKGELVRVGYVLLLVEIRDEDDMVSNSFVMDKQNGIYEVIYTVEKAGIYFLEIKFYGYYIKGLLFKFKVINVGEEVDYFNNFKISRIFNVKQKGIKRFLSFRSYGLNRRSNVIEDDLVIRVGEKGRNKGEFFNFQGLYVVGDKIIIVDSNN